MKIEKENKEALAKNDTVIVKDIKENEKESDKLENEYTVVYKGYLESILTMAILATELLKKMK